MKFVSMLFVLPALFFACRDHNDLLPAPTPCEGRVDTGADTADTAVDTGTDTASTDTGATDTATSAP